MDRDLIDILNKDNEYPFDMPNCLYYDPKNTNIVNASNFKYKILHLNIQSTAEKYTDFRVLLDDLNSQGLQFDFILVCETFSNQFNCKKYALPSYHLEPNFRKTMIRGGVSIYIKQNIPYKIRHDLSIFNEGIYESLFIELVNEKVIIGEIYRIPKSSPNVFLTNYEFVVNTTLNEKKQLIIGTDQNLDLLKMESDVPTKNLLNFNFQNKILPLITKPTRVTPTSATLIDNIYTTFTLEKSITSGIFDRKLSDHFPVFALIGNSTLPKNVSKERQYKRCFTPHVINLIKHDLDVVNWGVIDNLNCEDSYNYLTSILTNIINARAPPKLVKIKDIKFSEPWFTKAMKQSSSKLDDLHTNTKNKPPDDISHIEYKKYRNLYNSVKRRAKQDYYNSQFVKYYNNSRKTWSFLNNLIGKTKKDSAPSSYFLINDKPVTDPKSICDNFNNFFANVGKVQSSSIPTVSQTADEYLRGNYPNSFYFTPTDEYEIVKIINDVKNKHSSGHDEISPFLLKRIVHSIASPLSKIFNKSFSEGIFPDSMKLAKVIPIYKSKEHYLLNNYRPISLLPAISKILEKLVFTRLSNYLVDKNVLDDRQYGFRKKASTIDAISDLYSSILKSLEKNEKVLAVFCDLSKAFDTLNHTILLKKLNHYGIRGVALEWFTNYLKERKIYTYFNNTESTSTENVEYGVPQGSVLGPLLFILYINDLKNSLENSSAILFADDTTLYNNNKSEEILFRETNVDLDLISNWFKANKLSINALKTKYILFRKKTHKISSFHNLTLDGKILERVQSTCFLGMHFDEILSWNTHIDNLHKKLSSCLYALNCSKRLIDKRNKIKLYYALFESRLRYGINLWYNTTKQNINKITKLQKRALRIIYNEKYNASTEPLFKQSKIMNIHGLYEKDILTMMYKFYHYKTLPYLDNIFTRNNDIHRHNTRHRHDPHIQSYKLQISLNSFLHKAPFMWSSIDMSIKSAPSLYSFNRRLKKHLLT